MLDPRFFRLQLLQGVAQCDSPIFQSVCQLVDLPDGGLNQDGRVQIALAEFRRRICKTNDGLTDPP